MRHRFFLLLCSFQIMCVLLIGLAQTPPLVGASQDAMLSISKSQEVDPGLEAQETGLHDVYHIIYGSELPL